ncbi:MAG: amidohydrolase family protein, partial [Myxococcales bacterium]|nr:amidohydrolase family protein [Myxococcales bacterium]
MSRLLVRHIGTLVTMNAEREVLHDVDVAIVDNRISAIGEALELEGARVIDGGDCIGLPGFVNVHHHLFQTLTRVVPRVQNAELFDWLVENYKIWRHYAAEGIYLSAQVGLAELLLTGCTTTSDHLYLFPQSTSGELVDAEIRAAADLGIRFHPTRGSMSLGESCGGLPPDVICQDDETILRDYERVVGLYHDPSPLAMCRIALAPCAPFNVTQNLLRETIRYARQRGLLCHTHLAETLDEERYCLETYGKRPLQFMEDLEWLGPEVWYAHGIHFSDDELVQLAQTDTGVGHCPASNLRLGSGICRVPEMLDAGMRVGIGVDGSSSNDASNMLRELQLTLLVHRIGPNGVGAMPAGRVLELATLGGARVLRRED